MKRRKVSGTCLPTRRNCLGNLCGTSIDLDDIEFTSPKSNLVYMDKVFSFNDDTSCPLLFNLNTGGMNSNLFRTEFTTANNDCCRCTPVRLQKNAVFNIDRTLVLVEYFNTRPPGNINACQVTVDGFPVDSVCYSNGQYVAKTANLISRIENDRCLDAGLPTKTFFLINNAGPWDFRARYIVEGTVNTDGQCCKFCLEVVNAMNAANTSLPNGSLSNFAIPDLSLPCSINGIAPDIQFQFGANIKMVNPRLILTPVTARTAGQSDCDCECGGRVAPIAQTCCGEFNVSLATTLAIEPTVHVETVRQTLFCVTACESMQPCDGSLMDAEDEECSCAALTGPDCTCGTSLGNAGLTECGCQKQEVSNSCGCNESFNCGCDSCGCDSCGCDSCGCDSFEEEDCGCHQHNNMIQPRSTSRSGCGCRW